MMNNTTKKVCHLANALMKKGLTRSDAFRAAWATIKSAATKLLTFTKKSGEICTRVVDTNIGNYYTSKNTGKKKPEGLKLFADLAKVASGEKYVIISAYADSMSLA